MASLSSSPSPFSSLSQPALHQLNLPAHCTPTHALLTSISAFFHTCIPTPLALVSVTLGILSIVSWLFAQLPQIAKNFRLRSSSGLSAFFLIEWCLGDFSNLTGAVLTEQATWQITLASYYCLVDLVLVAQWLWYEKLKHGRHLKRMRLGLYRHQFDRDQDAARGADRDAKDPSAAMVITPAANASAANTAFVNPRYASSPRQGDSLSPNDTRRTQSRPIRQVPMTSSSSPLPSPSPRTLLMVSMVLCLCSTTIASPVSTLAVHGQPWPAPVVVKGEKSFAQTAGTVIAWLSAALYLGSRLPQLIKNARRRSTEGLSPLLFFAAFCGNFFYSASMLCNPLAWRRSVPPYGEHGWAPEEGSTNAAWITNALPFFLGAAGVLAMDASIGLQFWMFRPASASDDAEHPDRDRHILVVRDSSSESNVSTTSESASQRPVAMAKWRRVSGWMRGWSPGLNAFGTPPSASPIMGGNLAARFNADTSNASADGERRLLLPPAAAAASANAHYGGT